MDKITTVTQSNIWEVVEYLRSLDFGVVIGTLELDQYKVDIVYWPKRRFDFPAFKAHSPIRAMQLALTFAHSFLELDQVLAESPDPE